MMLKIIIYAAIIYSCYLVILFFAQRQLIYPGQHLTGQSENYFPHYEYRQTWLMTPTGKVEAWLMLANPQSEHKLPAVIFAHGNGELIDHWSDFFADYLSMGINVFLVEFPGYGRSEGSPSQKSIHETFVLGYDWLINQPEVDADTIIGHGRSIGGGAICDLMLVRKLKALILQSTFTTLKQFAHYYLAPEFLIRDPFNNEQNIKQFTGPILFVHGKQDQIIPFENSVVLQKAAINATLIAYDCGHNDCPNDFKDYWLQIKNFLTAHSII